MKPLHALLATGALLSTAFAAPLDTGEILVEVGDTYLTGPNTLTVVEILDHAMSDGFAWAAVVNLSPATYAIVGAPGLVIRSGVVMPNGDTASYFYDVEMDTQLSPMAVMYLEQGTSTNKIMLGFDAPVISDGDSVAGFGLPQGTVIHSIREMAYSSSKIMVSATLRRNQTYFQAALVYNVVSSTQVVPSFIAERSGVATTTFQPVTNILTGIDIDSSGAYTVPMLLQGGATALNHSGSAILLSGTNASIPMASWSNGFIASSVSGTTMGACKSAVTNSGSLSGVIVEGGNPFFPAPVAAQGVPLPCRPSVNVGAFTYTDVMTANDGRIAFCVPLVGGSTVLTDVDSVILETGVSTIDGRSVTALPYNQQAPFGLGYETGEMSPDGDRIMTLAELDGNTLALIRVESAIYEPQVTCIASPNSTGLPGRLFASGTNDIGDQCLSVVAVDLPTNVNGFLNAGSVPLPATAANGLCIAGNMLRFLGQIQSSGPDGTFATDVNLLFMPGGNTTVPGQSWNFQVWHRDLDANGNLTSRFTDAIKVTGI